MHETPVWLEHMLREHATLLESILDVIVGTKASAETTCSSRHAAAGTPSSSVEVTASVASGRCSLSTTGRFYRLVKREFNAW